PVPGVLGAPARRHRRDPEQDRAAGSDRQGPVRAAAGGARLGAAGADRPGLGARRPRGGQRVPAGRRRLHLGPDRDLDRAEAGRAGCAPAASAPARVRAVLRRLILRADDTAQTRLFAASATVRTVADRAGSRVPASRGGDPGGVPAGGFGWMVEVTSRLVAFDLDGTI